MWHMTVLYVAHLDSGEEDAASLLRDHVRVLQQLAGLLRLREDDGVQGLGVRTVVCIFFGFRFQISGFRGLMVQSF